MNLDPQQSKAVEHGDGPALVLAGPGSGKTAVITERTLRLVKKTKAPRRVLVITFTKAAAKEMEERYNAEASAFERGVNFGTFHAVFFRILREAPAYRGVKIIRNEDRYATALRVFSKKCGSRRFANDDVNHFLSAVSRKKSGKQEDGTGLPISASEFDEAFREYDKELERRGFIDFDDILTKCLSLLQNDEKALKRWREAFDYFLVDEYQDINRVQYDIIKLLAAPRNNLFVVGDDDQSIYAFRGAEPALAKEFLKDFPDAKTILLDRNYRSASCITRASLAVVKHNKERFEKKITADTQRKGKVESVCFEDRREEYEKLAEMLKAKGAESSAVLFRTNRQPAMLAHILEEKGVKFTVYGKLESLYTHHVTQDMLAYARIAAGSAERADFLRICNRPERFIKRELFTSERVDLDELEKRATARLEDVSALITDIKAIKGLDPYGVVMYVKRAAGYDEYLKNCAKYGGFDETELLEVLEEVTESARNVRNLAEWEEKLKADANDEKSSGSAGGSSGSAAQQEAGEAAGVKLMTFHASKGLEFRDVYIIDLNEGTAPLHHALEGEALEEERRAAYVAMTRAKENLTLMYAKKRGGRFAEPSRFILESGII